MTIPGAMPSKDQMQKAQSVGSKVFCDVVIDYEAGTINMKFTSDDPAGKQFIPNFMSNFGTTLCTQMSSFFAIKGRILEKNKKKR